MPNILRPKISDACMVTVIFQLRGVIQEKLVFTYTILNVDIKHLIALPCLELSNDEICLFDFFW